MFPQMAYDYDHWGSTADSHPSIPCGPSSSPECRFVCMLLRFVALSAERPSFLTVVLPPHPGLL